MVQKFPDRRQVRLPDYRPVSYTHLDVYKRQQLAKAAVLAPITGSVLAINTEEGKEEHSGAEVATLADLEMCIRDRSSPGSSARRPAGAEAKGEGKGEANEGESMRCMTAV